MKILIIGPTGVVGKAATEALRRDLRGRENSLILASRGSANKIDATNEESLRAFFSSLGQVPSLDAVVCAYGEVETQPWRELSIASMQKSLASKLFGQMLVAKYAESQIRDGGSITLTTGITSDELVINGMAKTIVNRAIEGFVETAALELTRGIRINAVSPGLLEESAPQAQPLFPGIPPVSGARVGREYQKSVFGIQSGKVFKAYE